jgi:hypothetical protein
MNYSYWRTERLILDAVDRRILRRTTPGDQILSVLTNPDVLAILTFCLVGLLLTLALALTTSSVQSAEVLQELL